jgi:hypothetical protein
MVRWIFLIVMLAIIKVEVQAQTKWFVNFTPGLSYVPPVPLIIIQNNFDPIKLWANYESAPLKLPPYYSYRLGFITDEQGWELEMNHLKVYLKNMPGEIDRFSISHGYNQLIINRINKRRSLHTKFGLGVVLAHPENTVRGFTLDEYKGIFGRGYYLRGPVIQYGAYRDIPLGRYFYILTEARISAAYARIPVVNGHAHAPVVALHLQIGPGLWIKTKNPKFN